ncbi:MAG: hypothetical protein HRT88_13390 [Lentisphaeraceae bacterium]|nr:hypothetical protein [Lentisphaeraceae bacterium]
MERVVFIVEETGARINCLLNPESFVVSRQAGLVERRSLNASIQGHELLDTPVLWTGGGRTQIDLQLLFDLGLMPSGSPVKDIRELTKPLHELAENSAAGKNRKAPIVRFVWGKAWLIRCLVSDISEHFDQFSRYGLPQRSWLSMRLIRLADSVAPVQTPPPALPLLINEEFQSDSKSASADITELEITGGPQGARLDLLAAEHYGNSAYWRLLAKFNDLDDPLNIPAGNKIKLPPLSVLGTL